jgi:antitoxin component of RelBE/YafQ-DinJ toxin-antitoxin module
MERAVQRTLTVQVDEAQEAALQQVAGELGGTLSDAAAVLLTEKLREQAYPNVDHRPSASGRLAYVRGHRTPVWIVAMLNRTFNGDIERLAAHISLPRRVVEEVLAYARAFASEIDPLVEDAVDMTLEKLRARYPLLQIVGAESGISPRAR